MSNAGGINPLECANALRSLAKEVEIDLKVAVITGDDLMNDTDEINHLGVKEMDSGEELPQKLESMNAYLG